MAFIVLAIIVVALAACGVLAGLVSQSNGGFITVGSLLGGVVLLVILFFAFGYTKVEYGHIGIVKSFGNLQGTVSSGAHLVAPWKSVASVSVQNNLRTYEMDAQANNAAVSKDSQPVYLTVQVNYQVEANGAVKLYQRTGGDFLNRILDPAVYQYTKEVTAEYRATDFAANRENIRKKIENRLSASVEPQGIQINNVTLKNVGFTPALSQAIERTVEAIQNAKQAQAQVQVVQAQAQQKIAAAEGDAKAQKLRRSTLTPELLQQEAIQALNRTDKTIIICQNGTCPNVLPLTGAAK